jgi:Acyl-CoA synthetases (AMP-forming)/AMP-acid ligases II
VIAAFVVARPGAPRTPPRSWRMPRSRLAAYKRPREVIFLDSLPRTANGKLLRRALGR